MKFVTFLKIFAICFFSLIGVFGAGYGIMKLTGKYSEPDVFPTNIKFDLDEYNVDKDFTAIIETTTKDVTKTKVNLSFITTNTVTENATLGTITDGIITIPKEVNVGTPFKIYLNKTKNDEECGGRDWITGGHSVIKAQSENEMISSVNTKINVDVPVYSVELKFSESNEGNNFSNDFILESNIFASLVFSPARSEFSYSKDGTQGYDVVKKNTYFTTRSNATSYLSQDGFTNKFNATAVADGIEVKGYVFTSSKQDEEYSEYGQDALLNKLEELSTDELVENTKAKSADSRLNILEINVDNMTCSGYIDDINTDSICTLYASKPITNNMINSSNLNILLKSSINESVSMQSKISNIGIRFLIKKGANGYYDAIEGEDAVMQMLAGGYSKKVVINTNETYYFPVITSNPNNSYWNFAVNSKVDSGCLIAEIKYMENDEIEAIQKSFGTKQVVSGAVSWSSEIISKNTVLNIYDDENTPEYEELNLAVYAQVPNENLYKTRKYFIFSTEENNNIALNIDCKAGAQYEINNIDSWLYELPDGILRAKNVEAINLESINIMFVTVETNHNGAIKTDENGKYIINQYSQNSIGEISSVEISFKKSVQGINSQIVIDSELENIEDITENQKYAYFVESTNELFTVELSCVKAEDSQIFSEAIENGDISIIAKVGDSVTDIISVTSYEQTTEGYTFNLSTNKLALGSESVNVKLFVSYKKSEQITTMSEIKTLVVEENETPATPTVLEYIEVYDGSAKQFKFGTVDSDLSVVSETKPINVTTEVLEVNNIISINTEYLIDGVDIKNKIFNKIDGIDDNEYDFSQIIITKLDKHGKEPVKSNYTLVSSNSATIVTTAKGITIVGDGVASVSLVQENGIIQDVLYFNTSTNGKISKVEKLTEQNGTQNKVDVYDNANTVDNYNYLKQTIQVVGYKGNSINLKSSNEGAANLMSFYFNNGINLTSLLKYSYRVEPDSTLTNENEYLDIDLTDKIDITQNFGQTATIELIASISELGLYQEITLVIKPNVDIVITADYNSTENIIDGVYTFNGVYSNTNFELISLPSFIDGNDNDLNYTWYISPVVGTLGEEIGSDDIYIKSFSRNEEIHSTTIIFNDLPERTKLVLSYAKSNSTNQTMYDVLKVIYVYIIPNVEIETVDNAIQYFDIETEIDLSNLITLKRTLEEEGLTDLGNVVYELIDNNKFSINNSILTQKSGQENYIDKVTELKIKISINTKEIDNNEYFNVQKNAIKNNDTYYVIIKVAPNIQINEISNQFITYKGQKYLALENGKEYSFENTDVNVISLKDCFEYSSNYELSANIIIEDYLSTGSELSGRFIISGVDDRLVFGENYSIKLNIKTGGTETNSLTFPIMLVPSLNIVGYGDQKTNAELDLFDLLDIEYLVNNNLYIELEGNETDKLLRFDNNLGLYISSEAVFSSSNLLEEDTFAYVNISLIEGDYKLSAKRVGNDVYVVVYELLSRKSGAMKIPYLVKIKNTLKMEVYYPYGETISETELFQNTQMRDILSDKNMEYLTFVNNVVTVNLNEEQSTFVPNKSKNNKRYVTYFINDENEKESYDEIITYFEVQEVWYKSALLGWRNAENVNVFTSITEGSKLTIVNANGIDSIRVRVRIYTRTGVEGYYYLSVGEIPNLTLLVKNPSDINIEVPNDYSLNFTAGETYDNTLSLFTLQSIGQSSSQNLTSILRFYAPAFMTITDNDSIEIISSVNSISSNLIAFTKYGIVKNISVYIASDYTYEVNDDYKYNESETIASLYDLNNYTIEELIEVKIGGANSDYIPTSISLVQENGELLATNPNYINIDENNNIKIGMVSRTETLYIKVVTDLSSDEIQDVFYNFISPVVINPSITIKSEITQNEPFNITEVQTASDLLEVDINDIFFNSKGRDLIETIIGNGIEENGYTSNNSKVVLSVLEGENAIKVEDSKTQIFYDYNEGLITLTPAMVSKDIIVLVCVKIEDIYSNVIKSYFKFTVAPNFNYNINYPKANEIAETPTEELFYVGTQANKLPLIFSASAIFDDTNTPRIYLDSDVYLSYKIRINKSKSNMNNVVVYNDSEPITNYDVFFAKDQVFRFMMSGTTATVEFDVYIFMGDTLAITESIDSYRVSLRSSISDVFGVSTQNFFTENAQNSYSNPEQIYVGTLDNNIYKVIKIKYKLISHIANQTKYYLKFKFGEDELVSEYGDNYLYEIDDTYFNSMQTVYCSLSNATVDANVLSFVVYADKEGSTIVDTEVFKLDLMFETRIKVTYMAQELSFTKLYNTIFTTNSALEINKNQVASAGFNISGQNISLTNYYYNYDYDVAFSTTELNVEAGQKISVLSYLENYTNSPLCDYSFGMRKITHNSVNYTILDNHEIAIKSIEIKDKEGGNYRSWIRGEQRLNENYKPYDIIFFAQGAPNEPITTYVTVSINFGANKILEQIFTVTIRNDYHITKTNNNDYSVNSTVNRCIIPFGSSSVTQSFAKYNSIVDAVGNYIIYVHKNSAQINSASMFTIIAKQGGDKFSRAQGVGDGVYDLLFNFEQVYFGDINIDLQFVDAYEYQFNYYITLKAETTPTYNGTQIVFFEGDEISIGDNADSDLVISFSDPSTSMNNVNVLGAEFVVNDIVFSTQNSNIDYKLGVMNGKVLKLAYFNQSSVLNSNGWPLSGKLYLELSKNDCISKVEVDLLIKQRFIYQQSNEVYVRDGIPFALSEVVDVIDNKSNLVVGERSLQNVHTLYVMADSVPTELSRYSWFVRLTMKSNGETQDIPISMSIDQSGMFYYSLQMLELIYSQSFDYSLYNFSLGSIDQSGVKSCADNYITQTMSSFRLKDVNGTEYSVRACLVDDVMLTINTRKINVNNLISVKLKDIDQRNISIDIECHNDEQKTISIYEKTQKSYTTSSIDFSYEGGDNIIIKGLSLADINKLKNIQYSFNGYTDDIGTLNLNSGELFNVDAEGIKYQKRNNVTLKVTNNENNIEYSIDDVEFRVCLKYMGVNTIDAYSSENLKIIYTNQDVNQDKLQNDYAVDLNVWAGEKDKNPFMLIAGKSGIQDLAEKTEDLVMSNNCADLAFALTYTNDNLVSLDENVLKFKAGYSVLNNYVSIDVKAKYGSDNSEIIGTVLVALRKIENLSYSVRTGLIYGEELNDSSYNITYNELCNAITISNGIKTWNGLELSSLEPTFIINDTEILPDGSYNYLGASDSIIDVKIKYKMSVSSNIKLIVKNNRLKENTTEVETGLILVSNESTIQLSDIKTEIGFHGITDIYGKSVTLSTILNYKIYVGNDEVGQEGLICNLTNEYLSLRIVIDDLTVAILNVKVIKPISINATIHGDNDILNVVYGRKVYLKIKTEGDVGTVFGTIGSNEYILVDESTEGCIIMGVGKDNSNNNVLFELNSVGYKDNCYYVYDENKIERTVQVSLSNLACYIYGVSYSELEIENNTIQYKGKVIITYSL